MLAKPSRRCIRPAGTVSADVMILHLRSSPLPPAFLRFCVCRLQAAVHPLRSCHTVCCCVRFGDQASQGLRRVQARITWCQALGQLFPRRPKPSKAFLNHLTGASNSP